MEEEEEQREKRERRVEKGERMRFSSKSEEQTLVARAETALLALYHLKLLQAPGGGLQAFQVGAAPVVVEAVAIVAAVALVGLEGQTRRF